MGYLLSGIRTFYNQYPEIEIHLFECDHNKLTPFEFSDDRIFYYKKSDYSNFESFKNICEQINPSLLIVSGRTNRHYLKIAHLFKRNTLTVSIQDTQAQHSVKTFLKSISAKFLYHPYFSCIWTIGPYGISLAHKLGYGKEDIYNFCYSADIEMFNIDPASIPKRKSRKIIYVGRFSEEKNIDTLIKAFQNVNKRLNEKWTLTLVGNGKLNYQIDDLINVEIYPFQSPSDLKNLSKDSDVFCLPSKYEPWGLVVHEFASLGKALLISSKCGSKDTFLIDGYNGYSFDPTNLKDLEQKFNLIVSMSDEDLYQFKIKSVLMSRSISSEIWAAQLNALYTRSLCNK